VQVVLISRLRLAPPLLIAAPDQPDKFLWVHIMTMRAQRALLGHRPAIAGSFWRNLTRCGAQICRAHA